MSKREDFYNYYKRPAADRNRPVVRNSLTDLLEKSAAVTAAANSPYAFKGNQKVFSVVVRCDLNGYSTWAREKDLKVRAQMLDEFFTYVVSQLDQAGGVYFRDEGDCVVVIFSEYFNANATFNGVTSFCRSVASRDYSAGGETLNAKVVVSCGDIAIFQKSHEVGTGDWSAEGEPFVKSSRLEQAVASKQKVHYFAEDHKKYFVPHISYVGRGQVYYWACENESVQLPGFSLLGGWTELHVEEFIPAGKIAS